MGQFVRLDSSTNSKAFAAVEQPSTILYAVTVPNKSPEKGL
jgi:hypothetical protein